jgi:exopolysaccharide biosynthesis polyprenyl glycosylphosphotransferase
MSNDTHFVTPEWDLASGPAPNGNGANAGPEQNGVLLSGGHSNAGGAVALRLSPAATSVAVESLHAPRLEGGRQRFAHPVSSDALYRRTLAAADVVAGTAAFVLAGAVTGDHHVTVGALLMSPLLVLLAHPAGLYRRDEHLLRKTTLEEAPMLFQLATLYALFASLVAGRALGGQLEAAEVLALWGLLFILMLAGRALNRCLVRRISAVERCLVVGDADAADLLCRKFEVSFSLKATVIGRVPFGDEAEPGALNDSPALPTLGTLAGLGDMLLGADVDRVIVVPGGADETLEAIRAVQACGVKLSVVPRGLELVGSAFELDDVDGITLLGVRHAGPSRSSRALKRVMDLGGAVIGLFVLFPALLAVALAIKLTSPGPVLYRQKRVGQHSREFSMLKFRSMVDGADAQKVDLLGLNETEGLFKIADDPRVTPFGRFLRKSSLDELPQLWNVVRGEMSLVGPRPLVPDDDVKIEGWQRKRLDVTPGMTGAWQILGSTRVPLEEMVKLDYLYATRWSLWLDVRILLRTLSYVAGRRSA